MACLQLWNKAPWQGKIVNFLRYARATKIYQEKIARVENYPMRGVGCKQERGCSNFFHAYTFFDIYVQEKNTKANISFSSILNFFGSTYIILYRHNCRIFCFIIQCAKLEHVCQSSEILKYAWHFVFLKLFMHGVCN